MNPIERWLLHKAKQEMRGIRCQLPAEERGLRMLTARAVELPHVWGEARDAQRKTVRSLREEERLLADVVAALGKPSEADVVRAAAGLKKALHRTSDLMMADALENGFWYTSDAGPVEAPKPRKRKAPRKVGKKGRKR